MFFIVFKKQQLLQTSSGKDLNLGKTEDEVGVCKKMCGCSQREKNRMQNREAQESLAKLAHRA